MLKFESEDGTVLFEINDDDKEPKRVIPTESVMEDVYQKIGKDPFYPDTVIAFKVHKTYVVKLPDGNLTTMKARDFEKMFAKKEA